MKHIIGILIFLLPLHAFLITTLKCRFEIQVDILRFWKEIILIGLVIFLFFREYKAKDFSLKKIYHQNTLLGLTTAFIICSAVYIYFPFFELKAASVLGFRYDTFFLIAMIVGLYCGLQNEIRGFLKMLFLSTFGVLIIFLPWYLFGDISSLATYFGYSPEVSTYTANQCISFAQNVDGQHRFQGSFGGPIRFSVFLTIVYSLFFGWLLTSKRFTKQQKYFLAGGMSLLILPSIFFSYSKTSILGLICTACFFVFLSYQFIYNKKITKKFYFALAGICSLPVLLITIFKWELFLHLGAVINRLDNLKKALEMFYYNPIGYGLGIAGPASQIGNSIESAGSWQIATASVLSVHRFLPENWYVQIFLEQGIVGGFLFLALIILIGWRLILLVKSKRDFLSVGIASAYFALCFMALVTHAFEEAASSYILFFFIGLVLAESVRQEQNKKGKKKINTKEM